MVRMMKIEQVVPEGIDIPERLRSLQPGKVDQLAESMAAIGLQQPITVWSKAGDHLELVAGRHRTAAAIKLGWDYIDCIFANDMTEIDRQLWEIDENLMRADLSPTERDDHLARRKELWKQREVSAQAAPKPQGGRPAGFASETAAATGISKATINRSLSRADAIPGDIRAIIKHTKLDTGVYLDSLKGMGPEEQREKVKVDLAEPSIQQDAEIRAWNRACAARGKALQTVKQAWRRASAEDRRRIKAWVLEQETSADDGEAD